MDYTLGVYQAIGNMLEEIHIILVTDSAYQVIKNSVAIWIRLQNLLSKKLYFA